MLYEPKLWHGIEEKFPGLKVEEKGFQETNGYLGDTHFLLNLASQETPENFLILTGISKDGSDLGTFKEFVSSLTDVFLPSAIHVAYKLGNSIIVLWGFLSEPLEAKLQKTLVGTPKAQRIEL